MPIDFSRRIPAIRVCTSNKCTRSSQSFLHAWDWRIERWLFEMAKHSCGSGLGLTRSTISCSRICRLGAEQPHAAGGLRPFAASQRRAAESVLRESRGGGPAADAGAVGPTLLSYVAAHDSQALRLVPCLIAARAVAQRGVHRRRRFWPAQYDPSVQAIQMIRIAAWGDS